MKEEGNIPEEGASEGKKTKGEKPENPPESKEKPERGTKFIGFTRHSEGGAWTLFTQMLSSAESIRHKIGFLKGECEIHIEEIDLPQ